MKKNILEVKDLRKSFGKFAALQNLNFEIEEGRIVGLLGKNGAGKTTLIKSILGLYKDFDGQILYQGAPINTDDDEVMGTIGALVDTKFHEDLTAYDNLMLLLMASKIHGVRERKKRIGDILELVGLTDNAKDRVKSFSMGMKQRLALAQALMTETKLLILDEPFVGLDPLGIEFIKKKLQQLCKIEKVSIVFSSHQLAEVAELSEDIIVISGGKISFKGTYESLVNDAKRYRVKVKQQITLSKAQMGTVVLDVSEDGKEVFVNKNSGQLSQTLSLLLNSGVDILDISTEENALLQLFQEE